MNLNRINRHWPVPKNNSLHLIDTMSVYEAVECGLITEQESEIISIIWEQRL